VILLKAIKQMHPTIKQRFNMFTPLEFLLF